MNTKNNCCFIFPGQGSQYTSMLSRYYSDAILQTTFQTASDVLGFDLLELIQGSKAILDKTENTQPALLACSVALFRIWQRHQAIRPTVIAGHSLGEYSALVCSGVIDFADALDIVHFRGKIMQQSVPEGTGAMAAVLGLTDDQVKACCKQTTKELTDKGYIVEAANFNAPGQVVVAGHTEAVNQLILKAKETGAKRAILLPVSVPSHTTLMLPASKLLATKLDKINFNKPQIDIVQNFTATATDCENTIKENLIKQLYSPVRWSDSIRHIFNLSISKYIECGPGNVLTGLNKRIISESHESLSLDKNDSAWNNNELPQIFRTT